MQYLLFEDQSHLDLLPLTFTRPVYDLRIGIDKLAEKWERALGSPLLSYASGYLGTWFSNCNMEAESIGFNGKFIPNPEYAANLVAALETKTCIVNENKEVLAFRGVPAQLNSAEGLLTLPTFEAAGYKTLPLDFSSRPAIRFTWDIFMLNGQTIREDFAAITAGRSSAKIDDQHSIIYGADNIFLEEGVKIRAAILNAEDGPIYLGKGVQVQEGAIIHGAHAFCEGSTVNMGAKMRGDTTVGPQSKVGGEVANSVIQGFSNKGHEGYLGNSVLGYWCNLGADTNTSNLKNNYAEVKVWNYRTERFARTGTIFCGLVMGDHSKCGINTMFNTGTVVGVSANIFGAGYPRNFIPSFSWGGAAGLSTFTLPKAYEVAEAVMGRRKLPLDEKEKAILKEVFATTEKYRNWDRQKASKDEL